MAGPDINSIRMELPGGVSPEEEALTNPEEEQLTPSEIVGAAQDKPSDDAQLTPEEIQEARMLASGLTHDEIDEARLRAGQPGKGRLLPTVRYRIGGKGEERTFIGNYEEALKRKDGYRRQNMEILGPGEPSYQGPRFPEKGDVMNEIGRGLADSLSFGVAPLMGWSEEPRTGMGEMIGVTGPTAATGAAAIKYGGKMISALVKRADIRALEEGGSGKLMSGMEDLRPGVTGTRAEAASEAAHIVRKAYEEGREGIDTLWKNTIDQLGDTGVLPREPMQAAYATVKKYYDVDLGKKVKSALKAYLELPSAKNANILRLTINRNMTKLGDTPKDAALMELKKAHRTSIRMAIEQGNEGASLLKYAEDQTTRFHEIFKDNKMIKRLVKEDPAMLDTVIRDVVKPSLEENLSNMAAMKRALREYGAEGKDAFKKIGRTYMARELDQIFLKEGAGVFQDALAQRRVAMRIRDLFTRIGDQKLAVMFEGSDLADMRLLRKQMTAVADTHLPGVIAQTFHTVFPTKSLRGRIARTSAVYAGRGAVMGVVSKGVQAVGVGAGAGGSAYYFSQK